MCVYTYIYVYIYPVYYHCFRGFPGGSNGEESACNAGDPGSIPGSERSPGEGKGNPLQHSSLENSMDRGTWKAPVHGITELDITETLTLSLYQITVFPE